MNTIKSTVLIILMFTMIGLTKASAQDFNALLEAVDKIEASLAKLVQQEAATRDKQIAELKALIEERDAPATTGGVTEEQLIDIMTELAALRVEVAGLRRSLSDNADQLASIDPDSWVSPGASDEQVEMLAQRLASLDEKVETQIISQTKSPAKPVSKPSGPKTAVNGRLYSHGMVGFANGGEGESEFGLSRAYVTLKSKLSSFASLRVTTDFKAIDDKYNIILKYAYLDWAPGFASGYAKMRLGLQATQYIDQMNKLWGRRYIDKTVGDSRKFLTSSDFGISTIIAYGPKSKYGFVSLALLNGTSYSHVEEVNTSKDFNLVSLVKPLKNLKAFSKTTLLMQLYSGTQNNELDDIVNIDSSGTPWDTTTTIVGASDWKRQIVSIGGLLAWNSTLDFGFDMNFTTVGKGAGISAVKKRGLSFFGTFYLKKLITGSTFWSNLNFFGRVDTYDPNTGVDNDGQGLAIIGVESVPVKGFKVALNYRSESFQDDASDSDNMLYVSTLFKF